MTYYVIAQAVPSADPLSGGAGWLGAGLLGLVLCWLLLKHLPDKDRQITEVHRAKDDQIANQAMKFEKRIEDTVTLFRQESKEARETFERALKLITDHCREELGRIGEAVVKFSRGKSDRL